MHKPPFAIFCSLDYMSAAREARERLTRHAGTGGEAFAGSADGDNSTNGVDGLAFLEAKVPAGRDWPAAFDSRRELGAYRRSRKVMSAAAGGPEGLARAWAAEEQAYLSAVGTAMRPGALAALVIGDGGGMCGLASCQSSAAATGLFEFVASATIRRHPDGQDNGGRGSGRKRSGAPPGNRRTEHLVAFRRI